MYTFLLRKDAPHSTTMLCTCRNPQLQTILSSKRTKVDNQMQVEHLQRVPAMLRWELVCCNSLRGALSNSTQIQSMSDLWFSFHKRTCLNACCSHPNSCKGCDLQMDYLTSQYRKAQVHVNCMQRILWTKQTTVGSKMLVEGLLRV